MQNARCGSFGRILWCFIDKTGVFYEEWDLWASSRLEVPAFMEFADQ
jgi:hypothetical protein